MKSFTIPSVFLLIAFFGTMHAFSKEQMVIQGPSGEKMFGLGILRDMAFSPDGSLLALCGNQKCVLLDWETHKIVSEFPGGRAIFSPNQRGLFTLIPPSIVQWGLQSGEKIREYNTGAVGAWMIDLSADGKKLLSAGGDGVCRVWDVVEPTSGVNPIMNGHQ